MTAGGQGGSTFNAGDLHEYTRQVAEFLRVPYDMAERLLYSESDYRHYTANGQVVRENQGRGVGIGIAQVARSTAQAYGLDPENERQNVYAGLRYLREQYNTFHSWPLAYAAYRAGPQAVVAANNQIPPGVSQESLNFFLGRSGARLRNYVVGQGDIPAASQDYAQPGSGNGEPGDIPEFIELPGGVKIPNPAYGINKAGEGIRQTISGIPAGIASGVSNALTEAGIQTSNKAAEWWNANGGTVIFYGIALLSLIGAVIVMKSITVVNVSSRPQADNSTPLPTPALPTPTPVNADKGVGKVLGAASGQSVKTSQRISNTRILQQTRGQISRA